MLVGRRRTTASGVTTPASQRKPNTRRAVFLFLYKRPKNSEFNDYIDFILSSKITKLTFGKDDFVPRRPSKSLNLGNLDKQNSTIIREWNFFDAPVHSKAKLLPSHDQVLSLTSIGNVVGRYRQQGRLAAARVRTRAHRHRRRGGWGGGW